VKKFALHVLQMYFSLGKKPTITAVGKKIRLLQVMQMLQV